MKSELKKPEHIRSFAVGVLLWSLMPMFLISYYATDVKSREKSLTVAIKLLPPCVMESKRHYTGFDLELWEEIANNLKREFNYRLTDQWRIFSDLVEGKADIAFSCMPITHEGSGKVKVIGPLFDIHYYGFMFPEGSKLREPVNRTLLKLKKNGTYDRIHDKWFGTVGR